jgi:hypothetical protein
MKNKHWFLMVFFFIAIMIIANGALAGVEPSPFNVLIPLVKDFRTEITKANENFGRFDNSRGMHLYINTSIPAMQNLVKSMSSKAGVIGDRGMKIEMKGYIQKLNNILLTQKTNKTKKAAVVNSLSEMATILDKMEGLMK